MTAEHISPESCTYRCPDQRHPISRAVHLGRLAAFYPACRQCSHRDDTGTLSPRQVKQLAETRDRIQSPSLFHAEGAGGIYLNDLTPAVARDIAAAFGMLLRNQTINTASSEIHPSSLILHPSVVLAGDARPITAELVAAVAEGLRWTGCDVFDIGPATAACLAFAVHHLQAAGGILLGNPGQEPRTVGLQFWTAGPRPLSAGGSLEPIIQLYEAGVSRPTRTFGVMHRFQAQEPYLATFAEHYHALRPLRVVLHSASSPLVEYLKKLAATVACQVIPSRSTRHELPDQLRADAAHFAVCVDGNGETCQVLDDRGRTLSTDQLLLLLTPETGPIVLENTTPPALIQQFEQRKLRVITSDPRRASMSAALCEHRTRFGGGPSGRFWHLESGVPLPDALMTITQLLILLSRTDAPFSAILDTNSPQT